MNRLGRKIELVANVCIITFAIVIGVILVKRFLLKSPSNTSQVSAIAAGTKIDLPGMDWSKNGKTQKVDEEIILRSIATSNINFDISSSGLIQLKKGKVNKRLIAAIQNAQLRKDRTPQSTNNRNSESIFSSLGKPEASPSPAVMQPPIQTKNEQFFRFDLQKCRLSGSSVLCSLLITNTSEDRKVRINASSSILIDNTGNQARGRSASARTTRETLR